MIKMIIVVRVADCTVLKKPFFIVDIYAKPT